MKKIPGIFFIALMLLPGCTLDGPLTGKTDRYSLGMVQDEDPSKSSAEALFDMIAEGTAQRRVLGWIDRAT